MEAFFSVCLALISLNCGAAQVKGVVLADFDLAPGFRGALANQANALSREPGGVFLKLASLAALPSVESVQLETERQSARLLLSLAVEPPSLEERAQLEGLVGRTHAEKVEKFAAKFSARGAQAPPVRAALDGISRALSYAKEGEPRTLFNRFYSGQRILRSSVSDGPEIRPERTAMARGGPSFPTRLAEPMMSGEILDYGAGRGADSVFLKAKGHAVATYDPYYFPEKPGEKRRFDWVQLNYVLNVVPEVKTRAGILRDIHRRLNPGGRLLVSVRTKAEMDEQIIGKSWKKHRDGWITAAKTFQHGYTDEELVVQLQAQGFTVEKLLAPGIVVAARAADGGRPWGAMLRSLPFGKKLPQDLYLHRSTLEKLPPSALDAVLRALKALPKPARWTLAKLSMDGKSISFLWYPDFDDARHPALDSFYRVDLRTGSVRWTDHSMRDNKFILHRKESFVDISYPLYEKFRAQTVEEERAGLLGRADIGTQEGWKRALKKAGW